MKCPGCFDNLGEKGYCRKCRKELLQGKKISPVLPFNSPYTEDSNMFQDNTKKISISGVQIKYSLKREGDKLVLAESEGQYILKPVPTGTFRHLDQAPANEHLTMQIARQVYGLDVPPNALIFFKDGYPAYLVKRFDRLPDGNKLQQEDFAQISELSAESHGENYKYDLSYEEIAGLMNKHIAAYRIEIEKFFRRLLFNYAFSNGDAHLKNFSLISTGQGDHLLSPAYDLLATKIHMPDESDMALTLFKEGFSKAYEAYGYYTGQDFHEYGLRIGIKESRAAGILAEFEEVRQEVLDMIEVSRLSAETREKYKQFYMDKTARIGIKG